MNLTPRFLRKLLARRRLAATLKPCPQVRQRRMAQMSPERRARYERNIAEIERECGL